MTLLNQDFWRIWNSNRGVVEINKIQKRIPRDSHRWFRPVSSCANFDISPSARFRITNCDLITNKATPATSSIYRYHTMCNAYYPKSNVQLSDDPALDRLRASCATFEPTRIPKAGTKRRQASKAVRFGAMEVREIPQDEAASSIEQTWYTKEDYAKFMKRYLQDATAVAKVNKGKDNVVLQAFQHCQEGHFVLGFAMEKKLTKHFHSLYSMINGMERFCAREIFSDKKNRRNMYVDTVMIIQDNHTDYELQSRALRFACETISLPSKLFAHQIAVAAASSIVSPASILGQ